MLQALRARALCSALVSPLCLWACGGEQAPECQRYVVCQAAYDEAFGIEPRTDTSAYDEGGACWTGSPATAETCVSNCVSTTEALGDAANAAGQRLDACEG